MITLKKLANCQLRLDKKTLRCEKATVVIEETILELLNEEVGKEPVAQLFKILEENGLAIQFDNSQYK